MDPALPPFVDVQWLTADLDAVVLADVRASMDGSQGEHTYLEAHLPGAVFVDLDTVLAAPPSVEAWDGPIESGPVNRVPITRQVDAWPPERLVGTDELDHLREQDGVVVLDARDPARFAGEVESLDARAGHVPGARNAPFTANLAGGRLRLSTELRAHYGRLGATGSADVVAYCGSGVTACHDLLVLETLGIAGRLYPGSWSAWSADGSRPVATGRDEPGAHRPGG